MEGGPSAPSNHNNRIGGVTDSESIEGGEQPHQLRNRRVIITTRGPELPAMCLCCLSCYDNCTIGCWDRCFAPKAYDLESCPLTLKTGDVALFRSCAAGRFAGVNSLGTSPWDHTGIVWVHQGKPYIIDSGSFRYYPICKRPLDFDGTDSEGWDPSGSGPQMYPLAEFLEEQRKAPLQVPEGKRPWFYDRIGIRPLTRQLSEDELEAMAASIRSMRDMPYEKDSGQMVSAAVDACDCCGAAKNVEEQRSSLFCSEFVAAIYIDAGLLKKTPPACEYAPPDFSRDHGSNCSSFLCCCWLSWCLGRCCGCGDIRRKEGGHLFGKVVMLNTPTPA